MNTFLMWLLISIGAGLILFPVTYFYEKWENKREGIVVSKKKTLQLASVMSALPVVACIVTWLGIWFNF